MLWRVCNYEDITNDQSKEIHEIKETETIATEKKNRQEKDKTEITH